MLTILPPPARLRCGYAACAATNALVRFVSTTSFHSSRLYSCGCLRTFMPALLTRMSRRPSRCAASSTIARQDFSSVRSACRANALPPSCFTAAAFFALSRPAMATAAPACASPRAMPRPMPPLPPVTSAALPLRSNTLLLPRIVLRVDEVERVRAAARDLEHHRSALRHLVVRHVRLLEDEAAGRVFLQLRLVEGRALGEMERAREHRDLQVHRVRMRRGLEAGRVLHAGDERLFLGPVAPNRGDLRAGGRIALVFELLGLELLRVNQDGGDAA